MMATFPLHLRHQQEHEHTQRIKTQLANAAEPPPTTTISRPAGDKIKLRGIPVVGVPGGIGGAIPGTKP